MVDNQIASNSTIHDVLPTLRAPTEYVRGILMNLMSYRENGVDPVVRIGITGQGISPYYLIERSNLKIAAFNGDSHRPFRNIELHDSNWSEVALGIGEVQAILGQLRGWKTKRQQT